MFIFALVSKSSNIVAAKWQECPTGQLSHLHSQVFQVKASQHRNSPISIPIQGLTESGKYGESGPTAIPPAHVAKDSDTEPAQLPRLEETTALATQLRRLHALLAAAQALCLASEPQNRLINHLAKTSPVQVGLDP